MTLRTTQIRPRSHRFTTFTSSRRPAHSERRPPQRRTSAELRAQSALFLVPPGAKPGPSRKGKLRPAGWLFLAFAVTAAVALCWTLL